MKVDVLVAEIGSTTTVVNAFIGLDTDKPIFWAQGQAPTSVLEGDVRIGLQGAVDDLKAKISYYQQPEHQQELEAIAKAGCEFVRSHFNGKAAAESLLNNLLDAQKRWLALHPNNRD